MCAVPELLHQLSLVYIGRLKCLCVWSLSLSASSPSQSVIRRLSEDDLNLDDRFFKAIMAIEGEDQPVIVDSVRVRCDKKGGFSMTTQTVADSSMIALQLPSIQTGTEMM